jgi:hypothetical protein
MASYWLKYAIEDNKSLEAGAVFKAIVGVIRTTTTTTKALLFNV